MVALLSSLILLLTFSEFSCRGSSSLSRSEIYDKRVNVFSPQGELLQIQYADIAAKKGELVIAALSKEKSVVICKALTPTSVLLKKPQENKLVRLNDLNFLALSGMAGDACAFVANAKQYSASVKRSYDLTLGATSMANHLSHVQYQSTLTSGNRPYGLNAILIGYESSILDTPALFCMDASGNILQCKATAIGQDADNALSYLEETYSHNMNETDLVAFLQSTMRKFIRRSDEQGEIVDERYNQLSFETFIVKDGKVILFAFS